MYFKLPPEKLEQILNMLMEAPAKYSYPVIVNLTNLEKYEEPNTGDNPSDKPADTKKRTRPLRTLREDLNSSKRTADVPQQKRQAKAKQDS